MQRKILLTVATVAASLLCVSQASAAATANAAENKFIKGVFRHFDVDHDVNADVCTYRYCRCDEDHLNAGKAFIHIELQNRGINVMNLTNVDATGLRIYKIDLSGNYALSGNLADSWDRLDLLEELNMNGRGFFGQIPVWSLMKSIRKIDLGNCYLCYDMPNWRFAVMPLLEELSLASNQLVHFSESFGTFSASTALTSVNLGDNKFCACSPDTWTSVLLKAAAE